jgi:hypothetical protein
MTLHLEKTLLNYLECEDVMIEIYWNKESRGVDLSQRYVIGFDLYMIIV